MRSTWPSNIRLQQYLNILIFLLAWEPTGVIVNPTVYPPLVVNYDFFSLTVELLNFGSQTLANNIPVGFPSSPIKCETINIYIYLRAVWIAPRDPQVYVRWRRQNVRKLKPEYNCTPLDGTARCLARSGVYIYQLKRNNLLITFYSYIYICDPC